MAKIIKVRCNGPNGHINEVDLDKALGETVVLRGGPAVQQSPVKAGAGNLPDRLILRCQSCTEGKVILTRDMIEENI